MNQSPVRTLVIILVVLVGAYLIFSQVKPKTTTETPGNPVTNPMTFFVTSTNPGKGADLGGLAGADQYCQTLATSVGAGDQVWRAYLSTSKTASESPVNARDRIGMGPWKNAKGVIIANSLDELHGNNNISKETALSEHGDMISGRGDTVNMHDMLTGSLPDGTASSEGTDTTCRNWTSSTDGSALLGHHDRKGLDESAAAKSWNSAHPSRGCSLEALKGTGGNGLFYCFAASK